jgi:hypothetical protein
MKNSAQQWLEERAVRLIAVGALLCLIGLADMPALQLLGATVMAIGSVLVAAAPAVSHRLLIVFHFRRRSAAMTPRQTATPPASKMLS